MNYKTLSSRPNTPWQRENPRRRKGDPPWSWYLCRHFQLIATVSSSRPTLAGCKVIIHQNLDTTLTFMIAGHRVGHEPHPMHFSRQNEPAFQVPVGWTIRP